MNPIFSQKGPIEIQYLVCQGVVVKMDSKIKSFIYKTGTDNIMGGEKNIPKYNNRH